MEFSSKHLTIAKIETLATSCLLRRRLVQITKSSLQQYVFYHFLTVASSQDQKVDAKEAQKTWGECHERIKMEDLPKPKSLMLSW